MIASDKKSEFSGLYQEFASAYLAASDGARHMNEYKAGREEGRRNFAEIAAVAARGEDITDQALLKLLPYTDTAANRQKGAWIHVAPTIRGDIKGWFERKGWTRPENWPQIAKAILDFACRCNDDPIQLPAACKEFSALSYTKGFQTGMLTPILNALRPDDFFLINYKPLKVINYFASTSCSHRLTDYPATVNIARELIAELSQEMQHPAGLDIREADRFDMFCHWLVAVKDYHFGSISYWKIAPGADAWNWEACRNGGFIAIGWDEIGDVSSLSRAEFNARRDELVAKYDDWNKVGVDQVWKFAHIKEGDRIAANHGTKKVLGIGTVLGPYEFVPGTRHGHHLPVKWDDLTPRRVKEVGWRRTLVELDREKFEEICRAPPPELKLAEPFSRIFKDRQEAEWAFDLLRETFQRLDITDPSDKRFALTFRDDKRVMRLNFGNWAVLQFYGPGYAQYRIGIALIAEQVHISGEYHTWGPFAHSEPIICVHDLPLELVKPLEGSLRQTYEDTFANIADRFRAWSASNYRRFSQPEVAEAVFESEKLDRLLTKGISPDKVKVVKEGGLEDGYQWETGKGCFTEKTFELLAQLHENPRRDFYLAHKEAFKEHVEEPFQQLMRSVADRLPAPITERMETQRRIFARILKNDFGQGGAWDFYWAAFYPKGGKRTEDAQLSMWIDHERLEWGFYIGDYGTRQRWRFLRNCQENDEALALLLHDILSDERLVYGKHEDISITPEGFVESRSGLDWQSWLRQPDEGNFDASVVLPKHRVLQYSTEQLSQEIAQTFERIFPLVLLVTTDDPLPAISTYLGPTDEEPEPNPEYSLAKCAEETGFAEEMLAGWVRAIERKKQAILYGPPGTGKTFLAEKLARHMVGGGDGFCEVVQFHPAYAYEDFIQGIRPQPHPDGGLNFSKVPGRFLDFSEKARSCQGCCVMIIDEINRANLARVFGELMYLLEYRDREIPLAGGGVFHIPSNVRVIGTMNTADRSIALVDHALRRRFAFLALYPNYDILRRYHQDTGFLVEGLIQVLRQLNSQIGDRHYEVGVSFFLREDLAEQIEDIWRMEIEPYLEEYFFDQPERAENFRWEQIGQQVSP